MKKILVVLLGVSLILSACGSGTSDDKKEKALTAEDKISVMTKFGELTAEELEAKLNENEYLQIESEQMLYFVKSEQLEEDKMDTEKLSAFFRDVEDFELFQVSNLENINSLEGIYQEEVEKGYIIFYVVIDGSNAMLSYGFMNNSNELVVSVMYNVEDGELVITNEMSEDDENYGEYKKLKEDYDDKAKEFFEDSFRELDKLVN